MQLEFLGTGAGSPSKQRNVTSVALKLLEELNETNLENKEIKEFNKFTKNN